MATRKSNTAQAPSNGSEDSATQKTAVYQLRVSLLDTSPPIWRRLLIPAEMSLAQLHRALQIAVGWEDMHLHQFRTARRRFGQPEPADPFSKSPAVEDERRVRLSDVLSKAGEKMLYIYDFGDDWEHEIEVEKLLPADANDIYPICVDGQLACPPEDCGGIVEYYDLLKVLAKPSHRRHKELREWLGGDFRPEEFSPEEVNRQFTPRKRSKKPSTQ
jgi:hypothetical protein